MYILDIHLFLFGTGLLFHVQFCCFLTYIQVFQEAGQVVWYSHLFQNCPQFIVIHTVKGFGIVNKAEIDVFLELSCFFHDPADIGNFISTHRLRLKKKKEFSRHTLFLFPESLIISIKLLTAYLLLKHIYLPCARYFAICYVRISEQ